MEDTTTARPATPQGSSTADLVKHLSEQIGRLARDEVRLAQLEIMRTGKRVGLGIGMFSGGGLLVLYGFGCLLAAAIIGLVARGNQGECAPMTESGLTPAGSGPGDAPPDDIQALTEEIKRTREDVGETVAALAAKADIMARVQAKAGEVAGHLRDAAGKVKEQLAVPQQRQVVLAVAAGVVLLAGALIARRHRR